MAIDFNMCFNEYITSTDKNHTRIIQDFNNEIRTRFDYQGREIYEMLQNAEDAGAEAESEVYVVVDYSDNVISIANKGGKPFSDEGFTSILRANQSSKIGSKLIGNKGLGFRSILNWAEEIEIHSKNIKCTFSEEIALKRWKEIQEKIEANIGEKKTKSFVKQVEKNAKDQGFDIPVPILPLPKYEKTTKSKEYTTKITIKLQDDESVADSIIDQLESLDERVLLFLTWCKSISITGNQVENRIITCDKNKWLFYSEEGSIGDKEYCISLAYPKEQSKLEDTNPLYSFFPTKINVNLPIIIHATFELTSSRNGLVDNDVNKKIQEFVANAVIDFVEQKLSSFYSAPSWDIYNAIDIDTNYDDIWTFKYRLDSLKKTAKIYPTINGVYECLKDIYYYSEDFSEYVISLKAKGWSGLNNILIPNKPENLDIKKSYNEAEFQKIINQLSEWITSIEDRCDLIKALKEIDTQIKFDLLLDQDNKLLSSTSGENVYINTGQYLKGLPDNLGLKFVNEDLIQYLIDNIFSIRTLGQENQKRNLSNYLNQICKVTTSDVASVKGELKKYSKKISQEPNHLLRNRYYRELIGCVIENQENLVDKSSTSETNSPTNEPWMLLAKDGSFYPAYNLILKPHKYFDGVERYMLDLSYFSINVEDSNSYENLFYNVLNISKYIPIVDENFSSDKTYLDYLKDKFDNEITLYNCRRAKNRIKNQTQFLADEYVSTLSITELVIAVHNDEKIKNLLKNNITIYYLRPRCQYDSFKVVDNYAKHKLLERFDCSKYVTSERNNFSGEVVDYDIISEYGIQSTEINYILLTIFGAKEDYRNFTVDELYTILNLIYKNQKYKEGKGVQSIYKKIREALLIKKNSNDLFDNDKYKENLYLYSKTHGRFYPCNELYYWDNDRLPKSILGKLPKFDIGSRVGENTVKELFFVKIPSTKEYSLENSVPNMNLQRELDAWLHDRLTFIYANSVRNISSQETKKRYSSGLKSLEIIVCTECMFKHEGNNMILKMDNDEIMPLEGKYYLNSNYTSISESMNNPQFWNSLTEIFCLTLKISSEDTYKTIRTILRNDWKFNKLDVDNYLSPEEWENACKDMGISEIEFEFWRKIIGEENFNAKLFKSNKLEYIEEYINVNISDIYDSDTIEFFNMSSDKRIKLYEKLRDCDVNGELFNSYFKNIFIDKYKKSFVELRNNSKNSYTKLLYEDYKDKHDEFLNIANEYMGQWIEDVVFDNKYYSDSEIRSLFEKEVENRFQFSWDGNNIAYSISILPQYINLLAKYNLSEIDLKNNKTMYSLSFFPSHDKELEDWMRSIVPDIQMDVANDIEDDYIVPVIVESKPVQLVKKNTVISNVSNYIGKTKRYVSDGAKSKIGKQSEKLVYNSMIQDSKFIDVIGISKNLDPVNGNDNAHYDITYKESSDLEHLRYLEVKTATYSDGHYSFLMSAYEYEFAKKHIDYYDVALVIDHDIIKIWKSFFKDKSSPSIHTYEVCVNIDND